MATATTSEALIKARVHPVLRQRTKIRAASLGISVQQYIEGLVKRDLKEARFPSSQKSLTDAEIGAAMDTAEHADR
ncbi:MAG: hypothetical protein M3P49_07715 [Actinomycetota bacterium]|nr:hypothetical protein [Actinomycetota bacterium]